MVLDLRFCFVEKDDEAIKKVQSENPVQKITQSRWIIISYKWLRNIRSKELIQSFNINHCFLVIVTNDIDDVGIEFIDDTLKGLNFQIISEIDFNPNEEIVEKLFRNMTKKLQFNVQLQDDVANVQRALQHGLSNGEKDYDLLNQFQQFGLFRNVVDQRKSSQFVYIEHDENDKTTMYTSVYSPIKSSVDKFYPNLRVSNSSDQSEFWTAAILPPSKANLANTYRQINKKCIVISIDEITNTSNIKKLPAFDYTFTYAKSDQPDLNLKRKQACLLDAFDFLSDRQLYFNIEKDQAKSKKQAPDLKKAIEKLRLTIESSRKLNK